MKTTEYQLCPVSWFMYSISRNLCLIFALYVTSKSLKYRQKYMQQKDITIYIHREPGKKETNAGLCENNITYGYFLLNFQSH